MKVSRRKFLGTCAGGTVTGIIGAPYLIAQEINHGVLPAPFTGKDGSFRSALQLRKSTRSFDTKPIPEQLLSDLLWAAFGVNRTKSGKRTAPSAYNKQEVDMYVITALGLFLYEPKLHSLKPIFSGDYRKLAGRHGYVKNAPVNIIYVSDYSKMMEMPENKKAILSAANTGFIGQNVYLFCALNGLGTVIRDGIDRVGLAKAMKLRDDQRIILGQSVGYPKS